MKKSSLFCGLIGSALVLGSASAGYAAALLSYGAADVYKVTVHKIELCTGSTGGSCEGAAIVGQGTKTFDIASAAAGAEVGAYGTMSNLQIGATYTHVRATIDASFDIAGTVSGVDGIGGGYCTTAETSLSIPAPGVMITAEALADMGIIHNGATVTAAGPLPAPITITSQAPSIDIAFGTSTALAAYNNSGNCAYIPAPPDVVFTLK